jgi:hypothetical protein
MSLTKVSAGVLNIDDLYGFRNRIINGDMRIAQRGTAAVTVDAATDFYPVDRFFGNGQATDGVFTLQQSSTVPSGFNNSIIATVTTADASIGASQRYLLGQRIEGLNVADLGWGTVNAKTVTLSFWVRSSVTGTFGGTIMNSGFNRSYPFNYTISSADTWEQKSVTIAGDTSGTWLKTNGIGTQIYWSFGAGSSVSGTANTWAGASYWQPTGATNLIGTLNATWYITGVQLEVGSVATPFERRPFGTELALCQRYLPAFISSGTASAIPGSGIGAATTFTSYNIPFMVQARVAPTGVTISSGAHFTLDDAVTLVACDGLSFNFASPYGAQVLPTRSAAGLTQFRPYNLRFNNASGRLLFTGCEL